MATTIHVVERQYRTGADGNATWDNKPACEAPAIDRKREGAIEVIADHTSPLMCKPCLERRVPQIHRFGLLVQE